MSGSCPSSERLKALLSTPLPVGEEAELAAHLSDCSACQALLETLAGPTGWSPFATKGRSDDAPARGEPPEGRRYGGRRHSSLLEHAMENLKARLDLPSEHTDTVSSRDETTPKCFGDYEILGEIGRGGMGVVYRARQLKADRLVALKVIASGPLASAARMERFRNEAHVVANLNHPNIVSVYEVGEHKGRSFFSMRLVEGRTLASAIAEDQFQMRSGPRRSARESRDSHRRIARLMATLARAVHYAHERGVLHRDLKPGNVLIDAHGTPHLTDFGLAKMLGSDSGITRTQELMGTPGYMAPEQARGKTEGITAAADVYGLGAILYELLAGKPPFQGTTPVAVLHDLLHSAPCPPTSSAHGAVLDLQTICLKCLEKEPARRYPSAAALADDLERFARGEPIQARPASIGEKLASWCRREPLLASLGAALVLVFGLGFAGVVREWQRAERTAERERREHQRAEAEALSARRHLYAADMNLARRACEEGNAPRALELLNAQQPKPGQEDLRGFEWYYLTNFCHQEQRTWSLAGLKSWKPGGIWNFAITPKANLLGVVLQSKHFRQAYRETVPQGPIPHVPNGFILILQDLTTGKILGSTRLPHKTPDGGTLQPDVFQFSRDGRHIALKCSSRIPPDGWLPAHYLALWDVNAILQASTDLAPRPTWAAEFPPAVGSEPRQRLWLLGPGAPSIAPGWLSVSGNRLIRSVVFSDNGEWIGALQENWEPAHGHGRVVYPTRKGAVTVWNRATHSVIANCEPLTEVGPGWTLAFSHDDRILSADSWNGSGDVYRWETGSWNPLTNGTTSADAENPALSGQINPGVLTNIFRQSAIARRTYQTRKAEGSLALSPDENLLALGEGEAVELRDARTGHLLHSLPGHTGHVRLVDFLPDGRTLVSVGEDGSVKFWKIAALDEATLLFSALNATNSQAQPFFMLRNFTRDGRMGISAGSPVVLRNLHTGVERVLGSTNRPGAGLASAFSPDGGLAAALQPPSLSGNKLPRVKVWEVPSGKEQASFEVNGGNWRVPVLTFSPDGRRLAYGCLTQSTIWDLVHQVEIRRFEANCLRLAFCGDNRHLAVISTNGASIWDLETGKSQEVPFLVKAEFAFSPDGKTLAMTPNATDQRPHPVALGDWSAEEPRYFLGSYEVSSLAFSPDGKTLAGTTREGLIRLWQVTTGDELFSLSGPSGYPGSLGDLTFTPDGRGLLAKLGSSLCLWGSAKP